MLIRSQYSDKYWMSCIAIHKRCRCLLLVLLSASWKLVIALALIITPPAQSTDCLEARKRLEEIRNSGDYAANRDLAEYMSLMGREFAEDIARLNENHLWFDGGAGDGNALYMYRTLRKLTVVTPRSTPTPQLLLMDSSVWFHDAIGSMVRSIPYLNRIITKKPEHRARVIGNTMRVKTQLPRDDAGFTLMQGRPFEDIPIEQFGRPDIITDVFGNFSYSKIDQVLSRYLEMAHDQTRIYLMLGKLKKTQIIVSHKKDMNEPALPLMQWIQTIPGINVKILNPADTRFNTPYAVMIQKKTNSTPLVPKLDFEKIVDATENPPTVQYRELPPGQLDW